MVSFTIAPYNRYKYRYRYCIENIISLIIIKGDHYRIGIMKIVDNATMI